MNPHFQYLLPYGGISLQPFSSLSCSWNRFCSGRHQPHNRVLLRLAFFAVEVFVTRFPAHILGLVVDKPSPHEVGLQKVVDGVLLGQLAVHRDQGGFQDHVGVAEVGDNLMDTVTCCGRACANQVETRGKK